LKQDMHGERAIFPHLFYLIFTTDFPRSLQGKR
jgi:hypothetical protein